MRTLAFGKVVLYGAMIFFILIGTGWAIYLCRAQSYDDGRKPLDPPLHKQSAEKVEKSKEKDLKERLAVLASISDVDLARAKTRIEDDKVRARASREEDVARAKARILTSLGKAKQIGETLQLLEKEIVSWATRIPELHASEAGKRIASSQAKLGQFAALTDKKRLSTQSLQSMREQLQTLKDPLEKAALDGASAYSPSESLIDDLRKLAQEAEQALEDYLVAKGVLETLLSDSAGAAPATVTLKQAVQEIQAQEARARGERIAVAKKSAYEDATKKLVDAERNGEEEIARLELKLKAAKQEAIKFQLEQTVAAEKKALERKKLEARYEEAMPRIKHYLMAFITPGYVQPIAPFRTAKGNTKNPVSFALLKAAGALEPTRSGITSFWFVTANEANDRHPGPFPRYPGFSNLESQWNNLNQEMATTAQNLLREFGEIMVEKGLLSP